MCVCVCVYVCVRVSVCKTVSVCECEDLLPIYNRIFLHSVTLLHCRKYIDSPIRVLNNWGQFHQHLTSSFCADNLAPKIFCAGSLALWVFGARILAQKLLVKCWWNWHLVNNYKYKQILAIFGVVDLPLNWQRENSLIQIKVAGWHLLSKAVCRKMCLLDGSTRSVKSA